MTMNELKAGDILICRAEPPLKTRVVRRRGSPRRQRRPYTSYLIVSIEHLPEGQLLSSSFLIKIVLLKTTPDRTTLVENIRYSYEDILVIPAEKVYRNGQLYCNTLVDNFDLTNDSQPVESLC